MQNATSTQFVLHISEQMEGIFEGIAGIGGRILVPSEVHIQNRDLAGFRGTPGYFREIADCGHKAPGDLNYIGVSFSMVRGSDHCFYCTSETFPLKKITFMSL